MDTQSEIRGRLREHFEEHPHAFFGVSGATLLHLALRAEERGVIVMPAYICSHLSEAVLQTGKTVLHIDANRRTMHPDCAKLESCLAAHDPSDTVLLIDHTFGNPFPGLAMLRRKFPRLLIIEDSVRALGARVNGHSPGEHSDWILLSMYKTILGPKNGAVLLTRNPISLRSERPVRATFRERAATVAPLRFVNDLVKRRHPQFTWERSGLMSPGWKLQCGVPSPLCLARFAAELLEFEVRASARTSVAAEFRAALREIPGVEVIETAPGCRAADHFVSFRMRKPRTRDPLLTHLHRQGLFLCNTWPIVPAHYRCFSDTFPAGHFESEYLSDHVAHIPIVLFHRSEPRKRLVRALQNLACEHAAHRVPA